MQVQRNSHTSDIQQIRIRDASKWQYFDTFNDSQTMTKILVFRGLLVHYVRYHIQDTVYKSLKIKS